MRFAAAACTLGALAGCDLLTDSFATNDFSGDLFPIHVETDSGAVVVGLRDGAVDRTAVLDLLSPLTLVDPRADIAPTVTSTDLLLLGQDNAGVLVLPRARLSSVSVVALHPCREEICNVGTAAAPRPIDAIVGADALAGDAVRLRLGLGEMFVLADVAGGELERGRACDAVFPSPYRGGGTLVIGGTELSFAGRRVTMQTCLGFDANPTLPQGERGADALMLISTSVSASLIGESAYERYRIVRNAPALSELPLDTVFLPSGPIEGHRTRIDNMALVARSNSTPRAPCRHVFAHHLLIARDCIAGDDCPCEGDVFCPIPAVLEIAPPAGTGIEVLVVPDDDPTLQALRTELRPDQPEVDGIIGTDALRSSELDIDYPHDRVLARCTSADCTARPALPARTERGSVAGCIARGPIPLP